MKTVVINERRIRSALDLDRRRKPDSGGVASFRVHRRKGSDHAAVARHRAREASTTKYRMQEKLFASATTSGSRTMLANALSRSKAQGPSHPGTLVLESPRV
jgi:hypothetical protein